MKLTPMSNQLKIMAESMLHTISRLLCWMNENVHLTYVIIPRNIPHEASFFCLGPPNLSRLASYIESDKNVVKYLGKWYIYIYHGPRHCDKWYCASRLCGTSLPVQFSSLTTLDAYPGCIATTPSTIAYI